MFIPFFIFLQQETQQLSMKYQTRKKALVLLADGTIFYGKSVGIEGTSTGEICFNTGMTGYQEIFTDPSYFGQLMVATNAHIGNYGVNDNEVESNGIKIAGLICRNFSFTHSRVDSDGNLKDWFQKHNLVAISDVDTRALVAYIRDNGAMNAIISTDVDNIDALKKQLASVPSMEGLELASKVSTKEPYFVGDENAELKVAVLDLGGDLKGQQCFVQDMQVHVVSGEILHVDFKIVAKGETTEVTVPVETTGEAAAVTKKEGILNQSMNELQIEAVPSKVPSSIMVDISELNTGDSIKVSDLKLPDGVIVLDDADAVVVSISGLQEEKEDEDGPSLEDVLADPNAGKEEAETE